MNEKFEKYLVSGATGFLGRAVITELLQTKSKIRALALENDPFTEELPRGIETVQGDVCDSGSLERFFAGADEKTCVIHCAGLVSVASHPGERIYKVNVGGTENVLRLCERSGIGKLVYVSSVHAIPEKPKGAVIDERTVFSPEKVRGDYAKSKAIATSLVFEAAKRGLNASVVFPSGVIGPGDRAKGNVSSMLTSFLAGKMPFAVRGGYDFADVRDVAKGIVSCAANGRAGEGYILSGHYASIREILELAAETIPARKPCYLPLILARVAAPFAEKRCLKKKRPLYFTPYAIAVLASNGNFDRGKATAALGYSPRPLRNSIRDMVQWISGSDADPI